MSSISFEKLSLSALGTMKHFLGTCSTLFLSLSWQISVHIHMLGWTGIWPFWSKKTKQFHVVQFNISLDNKSTEGRNCVLYIFIFPMTKTEFGTKWVLNICFSKSRKSYFNTTNSPLSDFPFQEWGKYWLDPSYKNNHWFKLHWL